MCPRIGEAPCEINAQDHRGNKTIPDTKRAQPSFRRGRAVARRRVPDAGAAARAAAAGRARARSPGGRHRQRGVLCGARLAVTKVARSLQELGDLRTALSKAQRQAAAEAERLRLQQLREKRERELFALTVGPVTP